MSNEKLNNSLARICLNLSCMCQDEHGISLEKEKMQPTGTAGHPLHAWVPLLPALLGRNNAATSQGRPSPAWDLLPALHEGPQEDKDMQPRTLERNP